MSGNASAELAGVARRMCWFGVLLILLGLATGAFIPMFDNARQGLSAHTAGVQNGIVLTVLGLLWRHLHLASRLERLAAVASVFSLYAIWIALVLAAAFGTSRSTPIAGTGYQGEAWQEALVSTLFGVGSGALIVAILCVLWGLRPAHGASE
jgi:(hydroxyamino)benzene mutase